MSTPYILGIDTSGRQARIAVGDSAGIMAVRTEINAEKGHAAGLITAVDNLLAGAGIARNEVECVAVGTGPGSFTGLRIGVTAAKMIAYGLSCRLVPVETGRALLEGCHGYGWGGGCREAGRGECFFSLYRRDGDEWRAVVPARTISWQEAVRQLSEHTHPGRVAVVCDQPTLPSGNMIDGGGDVFDLAAVDVAGNLLKLAGRYRQQWIVSKVVKASVTPLYVRRPAAEEKAFAGLPLVRLRRAGGADVKSMYEIERHARGCRWSERELAREVELPFADYLVAEKTTGEICGFAGQWLVAGEAQVTAVVVAAGCRRRGIGKMLIGELIARARVKGCSVMRLEVREGNYPAVSLYRSLGFTEVGLRSWYYDDPPEHALLMDLSLDGGVDGEK
ncbi:MAG: tRNA (adenosine(37)-N6)-threonylcarbamoyltransferase complex dimerization subunit type 1 TsaB [Negativicutes bacterium]|nr:tRNA (adenosine(37)-N6)-threonylcarbamoyltransferase complex dimerization subunit type 1 TsaB [Negativicutes bacterium]